MRHVLAVVALTLVAGCSAGSGGESAPARTVTATQTVTATPATDQSGKIFLCEYALREADAAFAKVAELSPVMSEMVNGYARSGRCGSQQSEPRAGQGRGRAR